MHLRAFLFLLLLSLATGCKTNRAWTANAPLKDYSPGTIRMCFNISPDQYDVAKRAVTMWNYSIHNWKVIDAHFTPAIPSTCDIVVNEIDKNTHDNKESTLAWATIGGPDINLIRGRYEKFAFKVILHEIGHALGAQHVAMTTMHPNVWSQETCPDGPTVAQIAAWHHVRVNMLNWCYNP